MNEYRCIYEVLVPIKRIPYWIFWAVVAIVAFLLSEYLASIHDDDEYLIARIAIAILLYQFPVCITWFSREFQKTMRELASIMWRDNDSFERWLEKHWKTTFSLADWKPWLFIVVVIALSLVSLIPLTPFFENQLLEIFIFIEIVVIGIMGGQSAFLILYSLVTLKNISDRTPSIPFYRLPHPSLSRLQAMYSTATLITIVAFIIVSIGASQSPLGLGPITVAWLISLSLFPLAMFSWSLSQNHFLHQKVKDSHLDKINHLVQESLTAAKSEPKPDPVEVLDHFMEIQSKVQTIRTWPIELQTAIAFILSVILLVVQVARLAFEFNGA